MPATKAKKPKPAAAPAGRPEPPPASVRLCVNGHTLTGERVGGVWAWASDEWPDLLAGRVPANNCPASVCGDFLLRAMRLGFAAG